MSSIICLLIFLEKALLKKHIKDLEELGLLLKIEPIVWRVSLKYKTMISESILIPGIPINEIDGYLKSTFIKETRIIN